MSLSDFEAISDQGQRLDEGKSAWASSSEDDREIKLAHYFVWLTWAYGFYKWKSLCGRHRLSRAPSRMNPDTTRECKVCLWIKALKDEKEVLPAT